MYEGIIEDTRSKAEKAKDWQFEEIVASGAPVQWSEKAPRDWRQFPVFNQGRSNSCVAMTLAKMIGIHFWNETGFFARLSATHIYQRRFNRPGAGMIGHNAFQIAQQGVTLEDFVPSQNLTDAQMDGARVHRFMEEVGKTFSLGQYLEVTRPSIDTIASIIQQTGKGVMLWFYFSDGLRPVEWTDVPQVHHPSLPTRGQNVARHSVTAVDFTLHNGRKALVIEDSWHINSKDNGRRIITEDFFNARLIFAAHFMNFRFEEPTVVKDAPFTSDLELNDRSPEVTRLQATLRRMGHFPANVEPTGFYGNVTADAVGKFQVANNVAQRGQPGFGRFGPATRAVMNRLIS